MSLEVEHRRDFPSLIRQHVECTCRCGRVHDLETDTAARERDEQLLLAGRDAVGIDSQLRKRQEDLAAQPKDKLDRLLDSLEEFDL